MIETLQRRDDAQFQADADSLIREAEERRINYMRQYAGRKGMSMALGILCVFAGACGFGWYLLREANLGMAVLSILAGLMPLFVFALWANRPLKVYVRDYKKHFMPQLAKAFGGLSFHEERGISENVLSKTGIMPAYDSYHAEDCFMGVYKGVKVIFSEARLYNRKKRHEPAFSGVFVLLEIPGAPLEGHTIVTADAAMVKDYAKTRWHKLQPVTLPTENPALNRFRIFSDTPDAATLFVGERLLKELSEASEIFGGCALTAVLFRQKYVFIALPHKEDMFEASQVQLPVASKAHTLQCKKEIERMLEIIDVFELYKSNDKAGKFGI